MLAKIPAVSVAFKGKKKISLQIKICQFLKSDNYNNTRHPCISTQSRLNSE